jgi:hypothetical protein
MEKKKFDFEDFAKKAADELRSGKPMVGRDGVFTPLLKMLIDCSRRVSVVMVSEAPVELVSVRMKKKRPLGRFFYGTKKSFYLYLMTKALWMNL